MAVACEPLEKSHRPITHWPPTDLADEVIKGRIVATISLRRVGVHGIYFLLDPNRTAVVALHHLPRTLDTLWLRLFARGQVQVAAEVLASPIDHPYRQQTLYQADIARSLFPRVDRLGDGFFDRATTTTSG